MFFQLQHQASQTTGTDLMVLPPVISSVFLSPLITSAEKASDSAKISISDAFLARSARKKHQNSLKSQFLMLFSPAPQEKSIRIR